MDFVLHIGSGEDDVLDTYSRLINRGTLDGFIVTAPDVGDPRIELLLARDIAFVVHGRDPEQDGYPYVDADNAAISRAAVEHLARLGHRRMALLNGPATSGYARERLRGFEEAIALLGPYPDSRLVLNGDTSDAYGRSAVNALLAERSRPTALLCCNSLVARGAYEALRQAGLDVPGDISVIAHDDLLPQAHTASFDPPLTVTRLPLRDAFEPLANLLIRRIAGESGAGMGEVLQASFIVRGSTAIPRHGG
jgi:LacI family transcriptional regulator